jgi:hypothetical protein
VDVGDVQLAEFFSVVTPLLHAKHPYLSIRWLRDLRTFARVDSWKPLKEVLLSESEVIAYASGRGYSAAGQQAA